MCEAAPRLRSHLSAAFDHRDGRTIARIEDCRAPLELRGPFESDGATNFYLRNVSCGVFAGDRYDVRLRATGGARAVVRPTSATTVHAMPEGFASSRTTLDAAPGATLVFVDGPLILQHDADFRQAVEITRRPDAIVAYAEIVVLGRLAHGELARFHHFANEIIVRDEDGDVRYSERYSLAPALGCSTILDASAAVLATVVVAGASSLPDNWSRLNLDGDDYVAGHDALPSEAGIVLRAAGSRLEPIVDLVQHACEDVNLLASCTP